MATPLITVLCYSAGVQSHGILRMVLDGTIPTPKRFTVVAADPGMESEVSIKFRGSAAEACRDKGIPFIVADGPNLFTDLRDLAASGNKRFDTPPLWTDNGSGEYAKLKQGCTQQYKIFPMQRAVRRELKRLWGIPVGHRGDHMLAKGAVHQWIGFTKDESNRADGLLRQRHPSFVSFGFPLIDLGLDKSDVVAVYLKHGWPIPVRSMCCGCPFHGLRSLKEMHDHRPSDWAKAVAFDNASRDLRQIGVNNPCYVSKTLKPLVELAASGFALDDPIQNDLAQCGSGVCFV